MGDNWGEESILKGMINAPEGRRRPIYYRWWFWVVFLPILLAGAWFLKNYYDWRGEYDLAHTDDYARGLTAQLFQYQADRLEEQYKNDTYGGDTPEETLRMFVEAVEKKDYSLAAKYYIPEKQNEVSKNFGSAESAALEQFVRSFKDGTVTITKFDSEDMYEVRIEHPSLTAPYFFRLVQNTFTHKWKILEP